MLRALGQQLERVLVEAGGEEHLDELLGERLRELEVDARVERDDAAVGAQRVALERAAVGLEAALAPSARPHGLLCLTITAAGVSLELVAQPRARCRDRAGC